MKTLEILFSIMLVIVLVVIASITGNWSESLNPDGLVLHAPNEEKAAVAKSAFGFGASMGLLAVSLLYCLVAAAVLIFRKSRRKPHGLLPLVIAAIAVLGFSSSYFVDRYFV